MPHFLAQPRSRRDFLTTLAGGLLGSSLAFPSQLRAQPPGDRPPRDSNIQVLNPRQRVPLSFIIDDSTCLVNLNRFAIPQFAEAWKHERYHHDWRSMPAEIPDSFVRKFGEWSRETGVKGKYSIVPYPACVGRLDRVVPGWTRPDINASLELVRSLMMPHWDIHPEMVTHTWVIDPRTGHPFPERSPAFMENWRWTDGKSVDELAEYMRYALQILKNVELPCEGLTTPGGFASRVLPDLSLASKQSLQDVFAVEIPHYFRHVIASGDASVEPRVENVSGLDTDRPDCVVSIIACTGDWTGGWDCSNRGDVDKFITPDLAGGRMVEVIERGEPAIMLCHWTGIYFNGEEVGFQVFQEAVRRLHARYDHLQWMKLSEIARYWAAKELTRARVVAGERRIVFDAPYAAPDFTVQIPALGEGKLRLTSGEQVTLLDRVGQPLALRSGTWRAMPEGRLVVCFDLPRGKSELSWAG